MKGLIQRVTEASVTVDDRTLAEISTGLLLLLGVERTDTSPDAAALCRKILSYRIFPDAQGRMNRSLLDIEGALLVVPQFTLAADTGSGTRPGFSQAAAPDHARALFLEFSDCAREQLGSSRVACGEFAADMKVRLINDGPVTFLLQTGSNV